MNKLYMGLDIGSITAKGVLIDEYNNIIASSYLYTEGEPVDAVKKVIIELKESINLNKYYVDSFGVTGSAKKLIGTLLGASIIKNEIVAEAVGTIKMYPSVRTIFEIGGEAAKIIIINNKKVVDYAISDFCMTGMGSFISSISKRLNVSVDEFAELAIKSKNKIDISRKCIRYAESDLVNKFQEGFKKEDLVSGICRVIANNFIDNVCMGKEIDGPIIFNGGVSKNKAIVSILEEILDKKIIVLKNSKLMGAFGVAIMAREKGIRKRFNFNIEDLKIEAKVSSCEGCDNNCKMVSIYKNDILIDTWGNRCDNGILVKNL